MGTNICAKSTRFVPTKLSNTLFMQEFSQQKLFCRRATTAYIDDATTIVVAARRASCMTEFHFAAIWAFNQR